MSTTNTPKMTRKAQAEQDKQQAIERLRDLFPIGSTVSTILRHVSRSGMSRSISVLATDDDGSISDVSYLIVRAGIAKFDPRHSGVTMGGCGMDMGFALVYRLARTIYRDGFPCTGVESACWSERCPSNDHSNEAGRVVLPAPVCLAA
jgi:hypothetical protein